MARKRMIDPDIWASEQFASLTRDARLLFIGMFSNADDYGRLKVTPKWLKMNIFPGDMIEDNDIVSWRGELEQAKDESGVALVSLYESGGKVFGFLPGFEKTQSRYKKFDPKYPTPPLEWLPPLSEEEQKKVGVDGTKKTPNSKPSDTKKTLSDTQAPPESHPIARNRNRKGEGGRGFGKNQDLPPLPPPQVADAPAADESQDPEPDIPDPVKILREQEERRKKKHRDDGYFTGPADDIDEVKRHFHQLTTFEPIPPFQRSKTEGIHAIIQAALNTIGKQALLDGIAEVVQANMATDPIRTLEKAVLEVRNKPEPFVFENAKAYE